METISVPIDVNEECINKGNFLSPANCPVAQAIRNVLSDKYYPSVGMQTFSIMSDREAIYSNPLDLQVREWLLKMGSYFNCRRLDRPAPFAFELELPIEVLKPEYQQSK